MVRSSERSSREAESVRRGPIYVLKASERPGFSVSVPILQYIIFYSPCKNSINAGCLRQCLDLRCSGAIAQAARAFAFVSGSISAQILVVLMETRPSHPRIVLISTPARSRCDAVEWRITWGPMVLFASEGALAQARLA